MTSADPILNALTQMEQRLREEIKDSFRELTLDLDGRFDAVHHRLDRLEQEYEMLKAGVGRVETDIGSLRGDVARLEKEIVFVRESVERLETRMEGDAFDREDLRTQAVEFRRRLDNLEGRVQEIEGRLPPE
jgi:chromosome segregation ATPase